MPRLFPSLGRSSKDQARYGQYEEYDAPHGSYDYGYAEQEPRQNRSAWSKVIPKKSTKRFAREGNSLHPHGSGYRTTVEDYPEDPRAVVPGIPTDDTESFEDLLPGRHTDNTVPLVQRESSLTRLQQAFADNGTYAPAMSAVPSGSHGAPFYAPQPVPIGQPHMSSVNDMHEPAVVVNNPVPIPLQGVRPDIVHHSASYPSHERPHHRHRERQHSAPPRSYRSHPAYWDRPLDPTEEPPVVVVVEHGRHGKKDKYYIIPGGAPVIFEDEDGNELTRVGDFSGHYRPPRRPRPVIVQDQYGREICRAGFTNDDHVSVGSDNYSHNGRRSGRSDYHSQSSHRSYDERGRGSHHGTSHSSARMHTHNDSYYRDPHYQTSRPRAGTRGDPEIYHADPRNARSARSGHSGSSSDTLGRSTSPRDHHSYHSHHSSSGRSHDRARGYGSDDRDRRRDDDYYRRGYRSRRHRGSTSSDSDSYDDRRSYRERRYRYDER
ncbi:hypothetical protein BD414DRAFT_24574 [Trametes punicea]|nr:hypothetical protein BD414DRAFT_24574 [Trametes punicea]